MHHAASPYHDRGGQAFAHQPRAAQDPLGVGLEAKPATARQSLQPKAPRANAEVRRPGRQHESARCLSTCE
jgi:hypothetical protein